MCSLHECMHHVLFVSLRPISGVKHKKLPSRKVCHFQVVGIETLSWSYEDEVRWRSEAHKN